MSKSTSRRVSVAPGRARRSKRNSSLLPEQADEKQIDRHKQRVIFNEEIAGLLIREEDLLKVAQRGKEAKKKKEEEEEEEKRRREQRVAVIREIPLSDRRPILRRVGLFRRAPSDAPLRPPNSVGHSGPKFNSRGQFVAHSILGTPQQFYRIGLQRGDFQLEQVPPQYREEAADSRQVSQMEQRMTPEGESDCSSNRTQFMPDIPLGIDCPHSWQQQRQQRQQQQQQHHESSRIRSCRIPFAKDATELTDTRWRGEKSEDSEDSEESESMASLMTRHAEDSLRRRQRSTSRSTGSTTASSTWRR